MLHVKRSKQSVNAKLRSLSTVNDPGSSRSRETCFILDLTMRWIENQTGRAEADMIKKGFIPVAISPSGGWNLILIPPNVVMYNRIFRIYI